MKFEKERKDSEAQKLYLAAVSYITAVKWDAYNTAGNGRRCDLEWQNSSLFHPGNYPANSGLSRPDATE